MNRASFIKSWAESLDLGSAAVFIGAGLSQAAGYPGWRELLREISVELGLDIDQEYDLAAIAQYSVNRAVGKRHQLAKLIVREFPPKAVAPAPFRYLARLPLRHLWTTNYDLLPETAWRNERKLLDVKSRNEDLGIDKPWAHAILYKMHGSVDHPMDVVIAKDDYELYRTMRPGFLQLLTGHLISKQILFLGFSFTDPNLSHLFGSIREAFRESGPEHYAIVRRPQLSKGRKARKRFEIEKIRHTLWVEDLQRYGIKSVEIDDYSEIDDILQELAMKLAGRSVFISGSFPDTFAAADLPKRKYIEEIARGVGETIAMRGKRLVSGFGLVVGSASLSGALGVLLQESAPNLDRGLMLQPFPQESPPGIKASAFRKQYRDGMIQQAGTCIFIAGVKSRPHSRGRSREEASGVLEEFETAARLGRSIIPIGVTGGAAATIWKKLDIDYTDHWPAALRKDFNILNDPHQPVDAVVAAVGRMLDSRDNSGKHKK
jgi:hypothetical protein